ncbi:MAG: hypothetical protein CEE38_12170 [Planctomycetes bacterium B3_Pla]|nr:MAG: hypothetical protein CEE38_12170 [Planctomycetes bacterium B3_Pla]
MRTEEPQANVGKFRRGLSNLDGQNSEKNTFLSMHRITEWLVVRLALFWAVSTLLALSTVIGDIPVVPLFILSVPAACVGVPRIIRRDGADWERLAGLLLGSAIVFTIVYVVSGFDVLFWSLVIGMGVICWMIVPRAFLAFLFTGALFSSIMAICQPPLHGTHRWIHISGLSFNTAHVLAAATVLWFASTRSNFLRFLSLAIGLACLIKSGSFTFAAVTSVVCLLLLAMKLQWGECALALAITVVCLISPLALSQNRIIRLTDYVVGGDRRPYQVTQARLCMRDLCYIGTSPAIRRHLPGVADDMSLMKFMIWGGTFTGGLLIVCHAVIVACIWFVLNRADAWGRSLGIAVMCFYVIILVLHILSNLTLIPSIGVSAPFQGRGLTNVVVGLLLLWIVSSASNVSCEATETPNSEPTEVMLLSVVVVTICYIVVCTVPLWVSLLFPAEI